MTEYNTTTKFYSTSYECASYTTITINKKNSNDYIVLKKYTDKRGWDIIDFHIDNTEDCDILKRAKSHRNDVSVFLDENSSEELINFFKRHNIRVKMQINFDYERYTK
jgi:hypothetical protein